MSTSQSSKRSKRARLLLYAWRGMIVAIVSTSFVRGCTTNDGIGLFDGGTVEDGGNGDGDAKGDGTHTIGQLGPGLRTLVGDASAGLVDGARNVSLFNNPVNVLVAESGNILVADFNNGVIREVTPAGLTTTLVKQTDFSRPFGMAITPSGDLYIQTDNDSSGAPTGALWRVAADTGQVSLVKGEVGRVRGIASLSDGRLVLADKFAHTVRIYDPILDTMYPLAGLANEPGFADGVGSAARFDEPLDVVITEADVIYVADSQNNRLRRVTLAGEVTTFAGTGESGALDGPALSARFDTPVGLALGEQEQLFVSEFASGLTRQVDDGLVSTIAGSTQGFADAENPLEGKIHVCEGLAFSWPYLYLADGNGGSEEPYHRVRRLDLSE